LFEHVFICQYFTAHAEGIKKIISTDANEYYHTKHARAVRTGAMVIYIDIGLPGVLHRVIYYADLQQGMHAGLASTLYSHAHAGDSHNTSDCRGLVLCTG
jgi:hypothetical protein